MDCNEARLLIDERVQGTLAPEHPARLDEHLLHCADCALDLRQLTKTRELIATARQDAPPAGTLERIWERIAAQSPSAELKNLTLEEREEPMSAAASISSPVYRPPLRLEEAPPPRSRWRLVAASSLIAAALMILCFSLGQMKFGEQGRVNQIVAGNSRDLSATNGVSETGFPVVTSTLSKDGFAKDKDGNDTAFDMPSSSPTSSGGGVGGGFIVSPDLAKPGELADHFETVNKLNDHSEKERSDRSGGASNRTLLLGLTETPATSARGAPVPGPALRPPSAMAMPGEPPAQKEGKDDGSRGRLDTKTVALKKLEAGERSSPQRDRDEAAKAPAKEGEVGATEKLDRPKIIKTGDLTVEVKNYVEASRAADALVVRFQGFVADSRTLDLPGGTKSGTLVIRIAPEKFEELFAELKKIGTVSQERAGGQDITAAFTDMEARIKNLQISEARLQELIKSKNFMDKMESLLQVEREMTRVRGEIEGYQGQIRVWGNQISLSTIRVTLQEPTRAVPSGSLSVEVASLAEAKKTLDASLSNAGAQLLSGQTNKREDGTLLGSYTLRAKFLRFGELVGAIKSLGRTQDEQIRNQPFGGAIPEGAEHVPCDLALQLFERSVQLPTGNLNLEVQGLGEAVERLNLALTAAQGTIISNQTQRQPDGSTHANLTLRVRAGNFQGLLDALPALGRVTHRAVNGEAGRIQGGAADVPCQVSLYLCERPKEVPTGRVAIEVQQFAAARDRLTQLIKEKDLQVLSSSSNRRPDGMWVGNFRLGIKADKMDEALAELEKLGRVKTRTGQGLGLGTLAKVDASVIGEVELVLEERAKQVPKGEFGVELEKFAEGREKLFALIKERELQVLYKNVSTTAGLTTGIFKLGVKADKIDEVVGEIEKLGRVKTRLGEGLGLGDAATLDASVIGELTVKLEERPGMTTQEEGAFRQMLRETFGGFLSSMGYIIRGLGMVLPWLAIFGVLIVLVLRAQRKKEAATGSVAARASGTPPAPSTPALGAGGDTGEPGNKGS